MFNVELFSMKSIEQKITRSILEVTKDSEAACNAQLHWRWSQFERKRRTIVRQEFKELLITNTEEYSILVYISHKEQASAIDITRYLTMEKSTVSEFIKRCISKKLIVEIQSQVDKRKKHYLLTELGKRILEQANQRIEAVNKQLFDSISNEEKQFLINVLIKL